MKAATLWQRERTAIVAKYGEEALTVARLSAELDQARMRMAALERDLFALGATESLARHVDGTQRDRVTTDTTNDVIDIQASKP